MPSVALGDWRDVGLPVLHQLEATIAAAGGDGPGRRWRTEQLNRQLFVALLAQFQGYCRALHDEAVAVHVAHASAGQGPMMQTLLTQGRKLDVGNPNRGNVGADFARLGFAFIADLNAEGQLTQSRLDKLEVLTRYRNAIAHGDLGKIAAVEADGAVAPTLRSYRATRQGMNALAGTMSSVVAERLAALLGIDRPW